MLINPRNIAHRIGSASAGQAAARAVLYQPVEKCLPGIFQPRQVRSKAPHGSQNNDLRRYFVITSL